jgi:hypothetical protein
MFVDYSMAKERQQVLALVNVISFFGTQKDVRNIE